MASGKAGASASGVAKLCISRASSAAFALENSVLRLETLRPSVLQPPLQEHIRPAGFDLRQPRLDLQIMSGKCLLLECKHPLHTQLTQTYAGKVGMEREPVVGILRAKALNFIVTDGCHVCWRHLGCDGIANQHRLPSI